MRITGHAWWHTCICSILWWNERFHWRHLYELRPLIITCLHHVSPSVIYSWYLTFLFVQLTSTHCDSMCFYLLIYPYIYVILIYVFYCAIFICKSYANKDIYIYIYMPGGQGMLNFFSFSSHMPCGLWAFQAITDAFWAPQNSIFKLTLILPPYALYAFWKSAYSILALPIPISYHVRGLQYALWVYAHGYPYVLWGFLFTPSFSTATTRNPLFLMNTYSAPISPAVFIEHPHTAGIF